MYPPNFIEIAEQFYVTRLFGSIWQILDFHGQSWNRKHFLRLIIDFRTSEFQKRCVFMCVCHVDVHRFRTWSLWSLALQALDVDVTSSCTCRQVRVVPDLPVFRIHSCEHHYSNQRRSFYQDDKNDKKKRCAPDMHDVSVHTPRALWSDRKRDLVLLCILKQVLTACETLEKRRNSPTRNYLQKKNYRRRISTLHKILAKTYDDLYWILNVDFR